MKTVPKSMACPNNLENNPFYKILVSQLKKEMSMDLSEKMVLVKQL